MKVRIGIAFGIGYVLGARAGRERYEEIRRAAEKVQSDPRVQEATQRATQKAEAAVREATEKVQSDPRVKEAAATAEQAASGGGRRVAGAADRASSGAESSGQHSGLADPDAHVEVPEDELVHSVGPDVEETMDEREGPGSHRA